MGSADGRTLRGGAEQRRTRPLRARRLDRRGTDRLREHPGGLHGVHGDARTWPGGRDRPRLGRVHRPRLGVRSPRPGQLAGDQQQRLLQRRKVARAGEGDPGRGRGGDRRRDRARGLRRCAQRRRRCLRRRGDRRILEAVRGWPRPGRHPRLLPLDGHGEARALGRQAGRARRADAAALGSRGRVRPDLRRPPLPARDPRRRARRARWQSVTSYSTRPPSARSRRSCASSAPSPGSRARTCWRSAPPPADPGSLSSAPRERRTAGRSPCRPVRRPSPRWRRHRRSRR